MVMVMGMGTKMNEEIWLKTNEKNNWQKNEFEQTNSAI